MGKKLTGWKTKGMNRDLSVSAFNPEFAFENRNLRLATNEGNTLMSWVNEKGTEKIELKDILSTLTIKGNEKYYEQEKFENIIHGTPIGTAVLGNRLILFTTENVKAPNSDDILHFDRIYVLWYTDDKTKITGIQKYKGDLGFSVTNPIETLSNYESENIQKVYWVDGKNQPRLINIQNDYYEITDNTHYSYYDYYSPTVFDFVNELELKETITVQKILGGNGMFAPGVIQYAFTYYNKNGQESNIFYTTPLYYISHADRGASPEDKVDNAFKIEVDQLDKNFDYLRIYSIQRTSIDGTPICKRIQDIYTRDAAKAEKKVSYTDTGLSGDAIDPTELLYKGGESIIAGTLEQKDNTLFFGDIALKRDNDAYLRWRDTLKNENSNHSDYYSFTNASRSIMPTEVSTGIYSYGNQLTSKDEAGNTVPCAGFKRGDYYRCGIQLQHKTGKWSDPIYLQEFQIENSPNIDPANGKITIPTIECHLYKGMDYLQDFYKAGYRKVRPVVVYPSIQDRITICQGVANPTMNTQRQRELDTIAGEHFNGNLQGQASWFFRLSEPEDLTEYVDERGAVYPNPGIAKNDDTDAVIDYTSRYIENSTTPGIYDLYNCKNIRRVEIQGEFDPIDKFRIRRNDLITLNSPDIEFDTSLWNIDFSNIKRYRKVGDVGVTGVLSDINIQTETPTISNNSSGFYHAAFKSTSPHGIVSGLFYDDFIVDDKPRDGVEGDGIKFEAYGREESSAKWMVYLWNKTGSLNNDINRPTDKGVQSSKLKKKIVSNLRVTNTTWVENIEEPEGDNITGAIQLFTSDQDTIVKVDGQIYKGNIDTLLVPNNTDGMYFAYEVEKNEEKPLESKYRTTNFTSTAWWKTHSVTGNTTELGYGLYKLKKNDSNYEWSDLGEDYNVGKYYIDLVAKKEGVRMKYKSTPHMVISNSNQFTKTGVWDKVGGTDKPTLPILEIIRSVPSNIFGGTSPDALKENLWIPCGEPVAIDTKENYVTLNYDYGDTYYQRWDCLKTYAFTPEDENQVVEIGSFMLETHVNIDGRYDRNRGQSDNTVMSPRNFNLLNPVYSQLNNFFSYRIMPDDFYKVDAYPNQITWSKTKESGADVDMWTNVTLASVLELDGDKGRVTSLQRLNNQLIAFQEKGISHILYNDNVQINSENGVPIEIANSGKVQGKDYKSDTIGCANKWSIINTPMGIYFMDSYNKSIFLFNGQLNNLSGSLGFNAWSKQNIPAVSSVWNPVDFDAFVSYYDKLNQDVLFINKDMALAYSERLGTFTSFYDYGKAPYFVNLEDTGIWINQSQIENEGQLADPTYYLWKHQGGADYCKFFDIQHPYWTVLIGNPEPQIDKIFTNLEFRACVDGDGSVENEKFTPYLPFDYLETWNEYQHGLANIGIRNGHDLFKHHPRDLSEPKAFDASLIRKFRTWRCDIPRSNASLERDEGLNCYRKDVRPQDRMRNPWLYLKLMKNANSSNKRAEIHDVVMTYFD